MKRTRNEREWGEDVPVCNVVYWWGKSCGALERFALSRLNWAHGTWDLSVLYSSGNAVAPGSWQAPFGLSEECSSSRRSPVRMCIIFTSQARR